MVLSNEKLESLVIYQVAAPATQTHFVILPSVRTCTGKIRDGTFELAAVLWLGKEKKKTCLTHNLYF